MSQRVSNDPYDLVVRLPYWLPHNARVDLETALRGLLVSIDVHPNLSVHLEAVLTELGVVAARDQVWPTASALVRRATGLADDVLPVRLSNDELAALLTVPTLPESVRAAISDAGRLRE